MRPIRVAQRRKEKVELKKAEKRLKNRKSLWILKKLPKFKKAKVLTRRECQGHCGLEKPIDDFTIANWTKKGYPQYYSKCKPCRAEGHRRKRNGLPPLPKSRKSPKKTHRDRRAEFWERAMAMGTFVQSLTRLPESHRDRKPLITPKDGHRFCKHCNQELSLDLFKTDTGNNGLICSTCRYNPTRINRDKFFNAARASLRQFLFADNERFNDKIGCTNTDLRKYLEKQFVNGMTWDNHGTLWHLDHYYPISKAYDHSSEAYLKALHYTNLRPILCADNLKKNANIPSEFFDINKFLNPAPAPKPTAPCTIWD